MDRRGSSFRSISNQKNIMEKRLRLDQIIGNIFNVAFRGFGEGCVEFPIRAYSHYYHRDRDHYYPGETLENTPEEVDAIIEGINRVNARWPGALRSVHPPKPKPEDMSQILWIMDSMVLWPHNRNDPPSDRDIIDVATGVAPV
jgi:hypothetical protein